MNKYIFSLICGFLVITGISADDAMAGPKPKVVPALPESGQSSPVDPCKKMKVKDIYTAQGPHDGVKFIFNGKTAKHDGGKDLYYNDQSGSSYVCEANAFFDSSTASPKLFTDFGWTRSSAGWGDYAKEHAQGDSFLDGVGKANKKSCYVCGLMRWKKGCFPPGVHIATDGQGGSKLVEDIAVGDMLWNPLTKEHARVRKVIEGAEEAPLIELAYDDVSLTVSQEHPVLTADGVKMARDLTLDDQVYDGQGAIHQLTNLEALPVNEGQTVINFVLEANAEHGDDGRMVLADGIVTGDLILQHALSDSNGD